VWGNFPWCSDEKGKKGGKIRLLLYGGSLCNRIGKGSKRYGGKKEKSPFVISNICTFSLLLNNH